MPLSKAKKAEYDRGRRRCDLGSEAKKTRGKWKPSLPNLPPIKKPEFEYDAEGWVIPQYD